MSEKDAAFDTLSYSIIMSLADCADILNDISKDRIRMSAILVFIIDSILRLGEPRKIHPVKYS